MIADGYKTNFSTLQRAILNGDTAIVEMQDAKTRKPVIVICALSHEKNGDITFAPLAKMFDGDPYEELIPPNLEGEA